MYEENGFTTLNPVEFEEFMDAKREREYALIDVRQPAEHAAGHIPGAQLVPLPEIETALPTLLGQRRDLVFYCAGGRRSRMAARMAIEAGATQRIYNLDNGFAGWAGLALSGAPKLEVFGEAPEKADLAELLLIAMDLEKAAEVFYVAVRDATHNADVRELMALLAPMERAHAALAYKRLAEIWDAAARGPLPDFETLYARLEGKVMEGGADRESLNAWIELAKTGHYIELAELGLAFETAAYDLYRVLADRYADPAGQAVFLDLADQEKAHARLLLDKLDAFVGAT